MGATSQWYKSQEPRAAKVKEMKNAFTSYLLVLRNAQNRESYEKIEKIIIIKNGRKEKLLR